MDNIKRDERERPCPACTEYEWQTRMSSETSQCPFSGDRTRDLNDPAAVALFVPRLLLPLLFELTFLVNSPSRHETINYPSAPIKNRFRSFKTNIYAHAPGRLPTDRARYFIFIAQVKCVGDPYTKRKTNFVHKPPPTIQTSNLCVSLKKKKQKYEQTISCFPLTRTTLFIPSRGTTYTFI